ncbi:MAG TPA: hypothetical protein VFP84_15290 [Kofleriaceae bacterium]|nr:hypothetical protein [Kofleriaceae bacterium]
MALEPSERLFVPHRKRLSRSFSINEDGVRELRIDYGDKEVTFDEERFFAFGEQLLEAPSFTGELATTWGPGYAWHELQPMLEALIEEGILHRGETIDETRVGGLVDSKLPPSQCPVHRFWANGETEAITRDLGGRAVENGYLEALVPIYRVAHAALDADDRQVGEGNVYPPRLRLERETEWRVCQYAGSRYRDDAPMNVTALKAMVKHWKSIMATILEVRAALRARFGDREGWTIGEMHTLSNVVLALPAYLLQKGGGTSPQVALDPVLSSLFRITDGIRMTTFNMLFSIERTRNANEPITARGLFERAEHEALLIDQTGVCAGPTHLIHEFLATVFDGVTADNVVGRALPDQVQALLGELPAAIDYGLYAMQAWGVSLSLWIDLSRAYEAAIDVLQAAPASDDPDRQARRMRLLGRLRTEWRAFVALQTVLDYDRDVHMTAYQDGYERAWRAARTPLGPPTLAEAIAPRAEEAGHAAARDELAHHLEAALGGGLGAPLAQITIDFARREQAIVARTAQIQDAINALLDRPRPTRPLTGRDLHTGYTIISGPNGFPYLFDAIERELGIAIDCTDAAVEVAARPARTA